MTMTMRSGEVVENPSVGAIVGELLSHSILRKELWGFSYLAIVLLATSERVAPSFDYLGYQARPHEVATVLFGVIASVVLFAIAPTSPGRPSTPAFGFLLATVAVPAVWIPIYYGTWSDALVRHMILVVATSFVALRICMSGRGSVRLRFSLSWSVFRYVAVAVVLGGVVYLMLAYNLTISTFSIFDVYDKRDEFNSEVDTLGVYLIGILVNAVLAVTYAAGLLRRDLVLGLTGGGGLVLIYTLSGFKSFLIGFFLISVAVPVVSRARVSTVWFKILGSVVLVAWVFDFATEGISATSILLRRAITTAGVNTANYLDFFSTNERFELKHSVLSFLGSAPFDMEPSHLIGWVYYNSSEMSANANFIADGYANFGMVGSVLAAAIVGLYLRVFDMFADGVPVALSSSSLLMILIAFSNSSVLTSLSTHGGFILLALVLLIPRADGWGSESGTVQPQTRSSSAEAPASAQTGARTGSVTGA